MREAHLRDLIAVIETGSIRSAARKLGLAQAAVSKNLTALEKSLRVPLLVRSARGVELTEYGRIVLRRCSRRSTCRSPLIAPKDGTSSTRSSARRATGTRSRR